MAADTPKTYQAGFVNMVADHVLKMQNSSIFVVGDVILDLYISGKVSRISPEAPVPVVVEQSRRAVLGGAANVSANVSAFGAKSYLAGRIGIDADGDEFLSICKNLGINTNGLVRSPNCPTTRKLRVLAGYQQVVRIDHEATALLSSGDEEKILAEFANFAAQKGAKSLVISDYGKGVLTPPLLAKLIGMANDHKIPVVTDPKSLDLKRYAGSTVIKPNLSEGREVLRAQKPGAHFDTPAQEFDAIADAVLATSGARNVVLSLSESGVMGRGADAKGTIKFKTRALQVADVSGAGDSMIAFLAMGLATSLSLSRSVQLANIAAGVVCGKLGTATVTSAELLSAFSQRESSIHPEKVVSRDEIAQVAAEFRREGKKVVFTNGCFDLLHAGHVMYLQEARSLGDVLILGLNADESVRKLKGPSRPIQTQDDRAFILAGLSCIDYVVVFPEETPLNLINAVRPHVLVKGNDWAPEKIVGAKETESWGGEVKTIPLLDGRSTTNLVNRSKMPQ